MTEQITANQLAEARRVIAQHEAQERETQAQKEREKYAELASKTEDVKEAIRSLAQIAAKASESGIYLRLDLSDIVDVVNEVDSSNTYHNSDWYSSSC